MPRAREERSSVTIAYFTMGVPKLHNVHEFSE